MRASRRDHLIDTALTLFYKHGFHATGIDQIVAEAGVAKMTLYNHFRSKDELILAALRRRDETFRNWFVRRVEAYGDDPKERLLGMFDAMAEWFRNPSFGGCMFINAAAEFADPEHPVHAASAEHKRLIAGYVRGRCVAVGARDPDRLASGLTLLMEGAICMAHVANQKEAIAQARQAAETLIEQSLRQQT